MKKYEQLCKPMKIGSVTIKNRFCVAPMSPGFTNYPSGEFKREGIEYYLRRAMGGFGLIYTGAFSSDKHVDAFNPLSPYPTNDPVAFRKTSLELNRRAAAYGAKLFAQITLGVGRNYAGVYAPSAIPVFANPDIIAPELTKEQIRLKIEDFVETANLCKESGFAGLEIHALHWGYLLDEFAMSLTNHRTDEYGGSLENRLRITKEALEAVKAACGQDYPVTIRLGMKAFVKDLDHASIDGSEEGGRTLEEAVEIAKLLESYGFDALSVDTGIYESFYYACPPMYIKRGYAIELAARIKEAVHIPVILGGRMGSADLAENAIADGKIDGIALGRPSLADPDFPKKVEMGTPEAIRPCIGCNQGCLHRLLATGEEAFCAVNPSVDRGCGTEITRALTPKKVVIVGGGVAGMEAARTAALRGHHVSLYEKTDRLGGNLIPAGAHDFKCEIRELNAWYQRELQNLGIDIHMNAELNAASIKELNPDTVVLSVGSKPLMPHLPGIDSEKTLSCLDVLSREKKIGQKVVVVGGGLVGCELAMELIQEGKDVTIVEALGSILSSGEAVPHPNKSYLIDYFEKEKTSILTDTRLAAINETGAVVTEKDGTEKTVEADTVIVAIGFRPLPSIREELLGNGFEVYEVGDGRHVGNILTAVWDANEVAKSI
ncbi:MAG: FAD-dependent oxidoreductase [Eubacteriales bacterium]|nr:FAD-dependent oxidoreductase [Eubacteriales bacterium]